MRASFETIISALCIRKIKINCHLDGSGDRVIVSKIFTSHERGEKLVTLRVEHVGIS